FRPHPPGTVGQHTTGVGRDGGASVARLLVTPGDEIPGIRLLAARGERGGRFSTSASDEPLQSSMAPGVTGAQPGHNPYPGSTRPACLAATRRCEPIELGYDFRLRWSAGLDRCLEGVPGAPTRH